MMATAALASSALALRPAMTEVHYRENTEEERVCIFKPNYKLLACSMQRRVEHGRFGHTDLIYLE